MAKAENEEYYPSEKLVSGTSRNVDAFSLEVTFSCVTLTKFYVGTICMYTRCPQ